MDKKLNGKDNGSIIILVLFLGYNSKIKRYLRTIEKNFESCGGNYGCDSCGGCNNEFIEVLNNIKNIIYNHKNNEKKSKK